METLNKFKSQQETLLKLYDDDMYAKAYFENFGEMYGISEKAWANTNKVVIPLVRFVANSLSKLYGKPVIRSINYENDEKLQSLFEEVREAYDKIALETDRYTFVTGMLAQKPYYDIETDSIEYINFTGNMISYKPKADNYKKVEELQLEFTYDDVDQMEAWTDTTYTYLVDGVTRTEEENIYGFIPFTIFRNKTIYTSWYTPPLYNLADLQNTLSFQMTQLGNLIKWQAGSLLTLFADVAPDNVNIGSQGILLLPSESSATYLNPDVDLNAVVKTIQDEINIFLKSNNLPESLFTVHRATSGVSITILQQALDQFIEERAKTFVHYEKQTLMNGMKVLAFHRGIELPKDLEMNINYTSVNKASYFMSEQDLNEWKFYLETNVLSAVDLYLKLNPATTREEAINQIQRNSEINKIFRENSIDQSKDL